MNGWSKVVLAAMLWSASDAPWQSLFNGNDLSQWEAVGEGTEVWSAQNGVIVNRGGGKNWLSTPREYAHFEFETEFRLPKEGNSGIYVHAPRDGKISRTGLEIQLLDETAKIHAQLEPAQYSGSVYGVAPCTERAAKPPGEWQTIRIVCEGRTLSVTLNGVLVNRVDLDAYPEQEAEHPGLKRESGYVGLQNHGSPCEFRNLRIRELP